MTTLAESFLADLDDLSDASDHEQGEEQEEDDADQVRRRCMVLKVDLRLCFKNLPAQMMVDDIEKLNYDSLEAVAHLRASERYTDIMQVGFVCRLCSTSRVLHSNIVTSDLSIRNAAMFISHSCAFWQALLI